MVLVQILKQFLPRQILTASDDPGQALVPDADLVLYAALATGELSKLPKPRIRKGLKAEEVALAMFLERLGNTEN